MNPSVLITGLLFGLSLIVAIGAQNAFVLVQGAQRRHVGSVVAICIASDVALCLAAVAGIGAVTTRSEALLKAIRWAGALLLVAYAVMSARRAIDPEAGGLPAIASSQERSAVIAAALAFTWLNPAVYLDMVAVGTVADSHAGSRWSFGTGVALGSTIWFLALGYGAAFLAPLLARPGAARVVDGLVALVMSVTAVRIVFA
jgi:L-lysine exporter family protein LysE/ArgO